MTRRKKITPRWLSLTRKIMIYVGGTTFLTMLFGRLFSQDVQDFAMQTYLTALGVIQLICDLSYQKDPLENMPADPKNPKIKE